MKTFSTLLALLTLVGCATSGVTTEERVQRGVRLAVQTGVIVDLKAHPERRFAYQQASQGLQNLVTEERWDASAFAIALSSTGNNLFTGGDASLILATVPEFISLVTGDKIDLRETRYVKPAILGANDGLATALAITKTAQAKITEEEKMSIYVQFLHKDDPSWKYTSRFFNDSNVVYCAK